MKTRWLILLGLLLVAPSFGEEKAKPADDKTYQSLVDNSPFLSPAFKARLVKHDTTALSFIGYTKIAAEWHFALIDKKSGETYWLKLNTEQEGIKVERFDEKAQQVHISVGGFGHDLPLLKEK